MSNKVPFKPRARLLLQLGDQLIRNESIALLELVKNGYDADASRVSVMMKNLNNNGQGEVIIEDNGCGMDMDIIKNVWMEPGSDHKEKLFQEKQRTPIFGRLPLGEKGIGRFGAHKLGDDIELITREKGGDEIRLHLDWKEIAKHKYLEDVNIDIRSQSPQVFTGNKSGTRMVIKDLKPEWSRGKEIKQYALYKFKCTLEGQEIKKFTYQFMPWPTMKKMEAKKITEEDKIISNIKKMVEKDNNVIDLSQHKIGAVSFIGYIFSREPRVLSLGVQDKKGLKEYLTQNGGIRVYRDGIRVYDYGEPDNDWLGLDIRRVNIPGKRISNNIIIGAVNLSRNDSADLVEKTNREGFIENSAYETFVRAILNVTDKVETLRKIDKDELRKHYGTNPVTEPVMSNLADLSDLINKKVKDESTREEAQRYIKRIEDDYKNIHEVLLKSAGAGLSLSVVIHEVEKIIDALKKVVEKQHPSERIISLVQHLSHVIEGYSFVIRGKGKKENDLIEIVNQALFNVEFRLEAHKISINKEFYRHKKSPIVKCSSSLVTSAIMNIIDNSIWWFNYDKTKNKKIYIKISDEMEDYLCLLIADNGPGFALPTEVLARPFVSAKPDGMGLGLHITKEIMDAHKGELIFPDRGDFEVPDEFKKGAIVVLAFNKKD